MKMEYSKQNYRKECLQIADLCEICDKNKAELTHHIRYNPPKTIRLCRSCHSILHKKSFPNHLWKEKRNGEERKKENLAKIKNHENKKNSNKGIENFL